MKWENHPKMSYEYGWNLKICYRSNGCVGPRRINALFVEFLIELKMQRDKFCHKRKCVKRQGISLGILTL